MVLSIINACVTVALVAILVWVVLVIKRLDKLVCLHGLELALITDILVVNKKKGEKEKEECEKKPEENG